MKIRRGLFWVLGGLALICILLVAAFILSSFSVTQKKIDKIQKGMTPEQVITLLGQPIHIDHAEITGLTGDVYSYTASGANAEVIFVNDKVFAATYHPHPGGGLRFL